MKKDNREQIYAEIVKLAKEAKYTQEEIGEIVQTSKFTVNRVMKAYGIMPLEKIKKLIKEHPEMSDEDIAQAAKVNVEGIKVLKQKIRNKSNRKQQTAKTTSASITKRNKKEAMQQTSKAKNEEVTPIEQKDIPTVTPIEQQGIQRVTSTERKDIPETTISRIKNALKNFPAVAAIAKEFRVPKSLVEELNREIEQEKYARTHTEEYFKKKRTELLDQLKAHQSNITELDAKVIKYKADTLLNEFSQFLKTQYDYAFIIYAYIKAKHYTEAIEIAESHLGLEGLTIDELSKKLEEIMLKRDDKSKKSNLSKNEKDSEGEEISI